MKLSALLCIPLLALACTAQQRAETARASQVFACEVAVLAPHVPEALDLDAFVLEVVTGKANLATALARLGLTLDQTNAVVDDFNTCFAGAQEQPAPAPPEELTAS